MSVGDFVDAGRPARAAVKHRPIESNANRLRRKSGSRNARGFRAQLRRGATARDGSEASQHNEANARDICITTNVGSSKPTLGSCLVSKSVCPRIIQYSLPVLHRSTTDGRPDLGEESVSYWAATLRGVRKLDRSCMRRSGSSSRAAITTRREEQHDCCSHLPDSANRGPADEFLERTAVK
jgi:hypothetical protein